MTRLLKTYLGLLALTAFSGLPLVFLYVPSAAPAAQASTQSQSGISAGWVLRGVHFWAAQVVVVAVFVYLVRILFAKAYRKRSLFKAPAVVGLTLLTLAFWFTGFLLPWDQLGFWVMKQASLLGTKWPSDPNTALLLIYWLHVLVLSVLTLLLLALAIRRTRRALPATA